MSATQDDSNSQTKRQAGENSLAAPIAIFVFLFSIYLISYSGVPTSDDEQLYAAVSQNLVTDGSFQAAQLSGNQRLQGMYSRAGPLHPVIGALVLAIVRSIPHFGSFQALFFLPPLYTALTAALIFSFARREGFSAKTGLTVALGFGLATIAWPYTQTYYREPLAMLLLFVAWLVFRSKRSTPGKWAAFSLLFLAAALTKLYVLLALPFFLIEIVQKHRTKLTWRSLALAGAILAAAVLLWWGLQLGTYTRLNANIWNVAIARVQGNLAGLLSPEGLKALAGILVSPGKGFLIYSPLALFGLAALARKDPNRRRLALIPAGTFAILAAAQLLIYHTGWWNISWSTRFLLPAIPLLTAAALPEIDAVLFGRKAGKIVLAAVLLAGILIQLGGVLVSDSTYLEILYRKFELGDLSEMIWDLNRMPAWRHWALVIGGTQPNLAFVRNLRYFPLLTVTVISILLVVSVYAGTRLRRVWKDEPIDGVFANRRSAAILTGYLGLIVPILLLSAYRLEPGYFPIWGSLPQASDTLSEQAREEDLVIVDGYQRAAWYHLMNYGRLETVWYSLPEHTQNWPATLEQISGQHPQPVRTWFLVETGRLESLELMLEYTYWSDFTCGAIDLDASISLDASQSALLLCEP